ncbi:hypothetical protein N9B31_06060 [Mariniblastus sp.]|jgi:hypothetical protein|nr:hypothetical protein [Mariniblastus sp.]MDA7903210.1 hypothetical protein [Mariniblastus sp.]MDB4380536.1 hypothetical protein [Mariniblastus sp.]
MKTFLSLTAIMFAVLCLNLSQTNGQDYEFSEYTLDFGGVQIGQFESDVTTITNNDTNPIQIAGYSFKNDPDNAFSIEGPDLAGAGIGGNGGTLDVDVIFSPSTDNYYEAQLEIIILTGPNDMFTEVITLIGNGTNQDDPCELVDDIRRFYKECLADGTLDGTGSGKRARRRERALNCRLRAISYLCRNGYYCYASWVTQSAIKRTDGLGCPRDFVEGSNLEALNNDLLLLQVLLQN